uniref:Trafficking protein particle complex subunit 9 n=1 Tax=Panagrellus redivivus TaxID=6233 RepID=A0A7E4UU45_PANRE
MDTHVPTAEDHCRISILVRTLGPRSPKTFNRLMERLSRIESIQVSDNPKRVILANFVTHANPELIKFGDLQAYRKVFGFIGVATGIGSASNSIHESLRSNSVFDGPSSRNNSTISIRSELSRKDSAPLDASLDTIHDQYKAVKSELETTAGLVDSRCVFLGYSDTSDCSIEPREVLSFGSLEESEELENGVRELLRSIYFILESRRIDTSFEKMDSPPCPMLPEEEKTRVGTENRASRNFKRKCIGRLRKQVADYALLTGLPSLALDSYTHAIEYLKSSSDLLWLAAAYEGFACAAMAIKYNETAERWRRQATMHRVSTMTPDQIRDYQEKAQHTLGVTIGHQRYRSDEDQRAVATAAAAAAQLIEQDIQQRKQYKKTWLLNVDRSPTGKSMTPEEILEKFVQALEHYERFSFASYVEYECMVRASSVYRHHRKYIETEMFLRERVGKYLDDSFTLFDNYTKAQICMVYAQIYREIGFRRKTSFFARLAVLFRLHVADSEARGEADYKLVYPILYRTLPGYGIVDNCRNAAQHGPVSVQVKAMHEVYMSALRANFMDAAIRHLCYMLQVYFPEFDDAAAQKTLDDLKRLVDSQDRLHSLAQHISLDQSGIILPPLQMTRFPTLSDFSIVRLPPQLTPRVITAASGAQKIFIYSPFQNEDESNDIHWVTNCLCEVSVRVLNPLPMKLEVRNLALLTEGCAFEATPLKLSLDKYTPDSEPAEIKLLGYPRAPGKLTVTGYSCEVLGVRNVCSIREVSPLTSTNHCTGSNLTNGEDPNAEKPGSQFTVEVLEELPLLVLETSLPRAPTTEDNVEKVAEATVFSGQTFDHSVFVVNTHPTITIKTVKLEVRQPTVFGPQLIELTNMELTKANNQSSDVTPMAVLHDLAPGERREVQFHIFGIDPASIADDKALGAEQKVLIKPALSPSTESDFEVTESTQSASADSEVGLGTNRNSVVSFNDDASVHNDASGTDRHDLIPYTGRLLTADFAFHYIADIVGPEGVQFERTARLPLAICIVPAVTVSRWQVLPGDSPATRYVVIDVTNSTDLDAELTYSADRRMIGVQPKEVCRVPVLCPCCPDVSSRSFREATQYDSHVRQKQEIDLLRRSLDAHIAKHLQIRWAIPQLNYGGIVPIGSILAEVEFLKQLVVPTVSVYAKVNGNANPSEDDITVRIGELVEVEFFITSVLKGTKSLHGQVSLRCFHDLGNGSILDRPENMVLCGPVSTPVVISSIESKSTEMPLENGNISPHEAENTGTTVNFAFLFLYEGTHKVRPVVGRPTVICPGEPILGEDEVFVPTLSFNVVTKVG